MRLFTLPLMAVGLAPMLATALSTSACNPGITPSCSSDNHNIVGHSHHRLATVIFLVIYSETSLTYLGEKGMQRRHGRVTALELW